MASRGWSLVDSLVCRPATDSGEPMRLKAIKLQGFKSFVDPTTVQLPGDMVSVVGPNGCGKSNIIDAVRWVMGESSAKTLRGESMSDVIFNGSSSRKPVGQAAIELVFDNADGSIGGPYAAYNEISVKRQVTRDAQSNYYLNGTRCRKRDITDVFLGTGLGPRSYSIIEQGTISRLIEARPEDLRGYLEEAAGISVYKERRRETERRIRDTRDNLERLEDVRDEVSRQLEKLQQQAQAAERYKALKAEERQRQAELHVLRLQALDAERESLARELSERNNNLEAELATQRRLENEAETLRARHAEDSDRLNEIQGNYYALGSEIARIDQQISHRRELRESRRQEAERNRESLAEIDQGLERDRAKLAELSERVEALEPEVETAREREDAAREQLRTEEQALSDWREAWERFSEAAAEQTRNAQVERTRIEQLERRAEELQRRRERLKTEADGLALESVREEIDKLTEQRESLDERIAEQRERYEGAGDRVEAEHNAAEQARERAEAQRSELNRQEARLTSLRTLQENELDESEPVTDWLRAHGLTEAPRLVHHLRVEPGWERAVETVLGPVLQSVVVPVLPALDGEGSGVLGSGQVTLLQQAGGEGMPDRGLGAKVGAPWALGELFRGVHTAETLDEACDVAADLPAGESVITPDGTWLGSRWLRLRGQGGDGETSTVARERLIAELDTEVASSRQLLETAEAEREQRQQARDANAAERDEIGEALASLQREHSTLEARIESRQSRLREAEERHEALTAELDEVAEQISHNDADVQAARGRLDEALRAAERDDAERQRLTDQKTEIDTRIETARQSLNDAQSRRQELALQLESTVSSRDSLVEGIERQQSQRERLQARIDELAAGLEELGESDEDLETEREEYLERRIAVEQELTDARQRLSDSDERLCELESQRAAAEQRVGELRQGMESSRMRDQELRIRAQTQAEQLESLGVERASVAAELPDDATEADWEKELERIGERIKRLGSINLAAIDEYEAANERKQYLDSQYQDLTEALATLQTAIQRIDRETRDRFRATFDAVSAGMQRLFPRLFGGGEAYLAMTGDDLLETGVAIMARPPGKKISNIHLLSGGEKALTAVSLVFAIFELNPAPFCMLDEVDAPLDEANVGRFCAMVREMSERVQFILITHNKTTMEASSHLAGVTMNEPGVSRLVSVDVEAAAEMAAL